MGKKKAVKCRKCKFRIESNNVGFIKDKTIRCAKFPEKTWKKCIFGEKGDPIYKECHLYDINISNDVCVYGYHANKIDI